MNNERANNERSEAKSRGPEFKAADCCAGAAEMAGFGEVDMKEMMRACPCGGWLKRHRLAVYTTMAGIGLGMLVLQVGWILGVIAFFRTF